MKLKLFVAALAGMVMFGATTVRAEHHPTAPSRFVRNASDHWQVPFTPGFVFATDGRVFYASLGYTRFLWQASHTATYGGNRRLKLGGIGAQFLMNPSTRDKTAFYAFGLECFPAAYRIWGPVHVTGGYTHLLGKKSGSGWQVQLTINKATSRTLR